MSQRSHSRRILKPVYCVKPCVVDNRRVRTRLAVSTVPPITTSFYNMAQSVSGRTYITCEPTRVSWSELVLTPRGARRFLTVSMGEAFCIVRKSSTEGMREARAGVGDCPLYRLGEDASWGRCPRQGCHRKPGSWLDGSPVAEINLG